MLSFELRRPQDSYPRSLLSTLDAVTRDFDSFFQGFDRSPQGGRPQEYQLNQLAACDIQESEKAFLLSFDLPGFKKDDISIELKDKTLTVSGSRSQEAASEQRPRWQERRHGEFKRGFTLSENIKADEIEANYENGVLYILVPKAEPVQPKRLTIGEGKGKLFETLVTEAKKAEDSVEGLKSPA